MRQGEVSWCQTKDHFGQSSAVHIRGFQGVYQLQPDDACTTSPCYLQPNAKIERWHRSTKSECIRPSVPLSLDLARRMIDAYVTYYNGVRLHKAIGYVSPRARLEGRDEAIWA